MVGVCSRKVAHAQLCAILTSSVIVQLPVVVASMHPVVALSSVAMFVSAVTKALAPAYDLTTPAPAPMSMARCMIGMVLVVATNLAKTAAAATAI